MNDKKFCSKCGKQKNIDEFTKDLRSPDGHFRICRECKNIIGREKYEKIKNDPEFRKRMRQNTIKYKNSHREQIREDALEYNNRQEVIERKLEWYRNKTKKVSIEILLKKMYERAKKRSVEQNLDFNIDLEDVKYEKFCPLLEIELNWEGGPRTINTPSLDKIDPKKGYVKGNVRVISTLANSIKFNASYDHLEKFSKNIMNYLQNKDIVQTIENNESIELQDKEPVS